LEDILHEDISEHHDNQLTDGNMIKAHAVSYCSPILLKGLTESEILSETNELNFFIRSKERLNTNYYLFVAVETNDPMVRYFVNCTKWLNFIFTMALVWFLNVRISWIPVTLQTAEHKILKTLSIIYLVYTEPFSSHWAASEAPWFRICQVVCNKLFFTYLMYFWLVTLKKISRSGGQGDSGELENLSLYRKELLLVSMYLVNHVYLFVFHLNLLEISKLKYFQDFMKQPYLGLEIFLIFAVYAILL
jgi:hypothetical protein